MIVFYDPETLKVHHVVVHAPEGYVQSLQQTENMSWVEVDEDIPPDEIMLTADKKVIRAQKVQGAIESAEVTPEEIEAYRERMKKVIDERSYLDMEPYLIAQKYLWATSDPVERAIVMEAEMLNMPLGELVSHIKHRYDEERVRLQWAELHRQKAKLALAVATTNEDIDRIVQSFDPNKPIDGIFVVDTSSNQ